MRRHRDWTPLAIGFVIVLTIGAVVWAVMSHHKHVQVCVKSGGKVEERYERTDTSFSYTYDSKGNITSITPVITQVYSYHCWVSGRETDSW